MASVSRKHRPFSERNNNPVRVPGTKQPPKQGRAFAVSADQALRASGVVFEALSTAHI